MIISDCEQWGPEYKKLKVGKPSSSHFGEIVKANGQPSESAKKYMHQMAVEKVTGIKEETYSNAIIRRGIELEPEARDLFRFIMGVKVREVGLCFPNERALYACSPDGLMMEEREGLEIKCPLSHTHVEYLLSGKLPIKYHRQVHGSMLVTGFKAWWFMSYYPGLPPLIIRVERDTEFLIKLKVALETFCEELDRVTDQLRGMV